MLPDTITAYLLTQILKAMKKLTLVVLSIIIVPLIVISQPCLPEGITFETQAQIDSFQINHPNCTEIEGNVYIGVWGGTDITNLNGLNVLTSIGGSVEIKGNDFLSSLSGLDNLTSIGGDVIIEYNDTLTTLTGLDNVNPNSINDLFITNNPLLSACNVQSICDYLVSPNGTINIYDNDMGCNSPPEIANDCGITLPCLPYGNYYFYTQNDVDDFAINYPNCTELEGIVSIVGDDITNLNGLIVLTSFIDDLEIFHNDALASLSGLDNVTSIGDDLKIHNNGALTSLSGLENIDSIGDDLSIINNDALTNLTGLDNMTSVTSISIENNDALSSLSGLNNLTSIGNELYISENNSLTSLSGLENIDSIGGFLRIYHNYALTSLSGLENMASIGALSIKSNDALISLSGLLNIDAIGYDLSISNNGALINLSGLDNLTAIGGNLRIGENDALTSFTGLENVTYIMDGLDIQENNSLISLTGLDNLTSVGEDVWIRGNPSLTNLSVLNNVTSIGGWLWIYRNDALTSLTGLDNIEYSTIEDLYIHNNSLLSTCEVVSVCAYLASPNGYIGISHNAIGCNSPEEVQDSCKAHEGIDYYRFVEYAILVTPNPFATSTTLSYNLNKPSIVTISIFNFLCQLIDKIEQKQAGGEQQVQWNAEGLPAGIYYFRIQAGEKVGGGKMVKMR